MDATQRSQPTDSRVAEAHALLLARVEEVVSGDDFRRLLTLASSFHKYSPQNRLLLASQGAQGHVGSYRFWGTVPSVDGGSCQVRRDEKAVRVFAPVPTRQRQVNELTGEEMSVAGPTRFRLVPVFHEGQLVAPPAWPLRPQLLIGGEQLAPVWASLAAEVERDGYALDRSPMLDHPGANGVTLFDERRVIVRDDVDLAQAVKTLIHELAHVRLHHPDRVPVEMSRQVKEVEAESVAFIVCQALQVDSATYSIPYVVHWAGGDPALVRTTAERALAASSRIITGLETTLDLDLTPDPVAALREVGGGGVGATVFVAPRSVAVVESSAVERVAALVARGGFDWEDVAEAIDRPDEREARQPMAWAGTPAQAGFDESATVDVLASLGAGPRETFEVVVATFDPSRPEQESTVVAVADLVGRRWVMSSADVAQMVARSNVELSDDDRYVFAQAALASRIGVEEQAAILIGLARGDADDSFRLLRGRRDPIDLAVAVAARLELSPHDVARTMGQSGSGFDNAIATVVRLHPAADLLAVARAAWPQLNHAAITELIAPHRPDRAAESLGAQLIQRWASVPSARAEQRTESLIDRWRTAASELGDRMTL